ncbi:MAG TPA: hypothetical protein VMD29_00685 [Terracidiphilus sp.]|nr:hypothetical protein [Terracidiphilus sp.]
MKWRTAILLTCALLIGAKGAAAQTARVGTFDRQAIALAYYRSPLWAEVLHQKRMELKAAQQANDQQKVDELNKWGGESQELAHKQVFSPNEPIDNILTAIAPAIQDLCKSENLSKVVPAPAPDASQTVDVTAQLLDWLKADEKTREIIRQMQQK